MSLLLQCFRAYLVEWYRLIVNEYQITCEWFLKNLKKIIYLRNLIMALPILWYEFEKENKKKYVSIQKMAFLK